MTRPQNLILHVGFGTPPGTIETVATNQNGDIDWYYDSVANNFIGYGTSLCRAGRC